MFTSPPLPLTILSNQHSNMKHGSTYLHACEAYPLHSFPAPDLSLAILVELATHNGTWPGPCELPHYIVKASTRRGIESIAGILY